MHAHTQEQQPKAWARLLVVEAPDVDAVVLRAGHNPLALLGVRDAERGKQAVLAVLVACAADVRALSSGACLLNLGLPSRAQSRWTAAAPPEFIQAVTKQQCS